MNILRTFTYHYTPGYPIHYVSLDRTPELWAQLAIDDTLAACGNTVRNITASELGVDVDEPLTSHLMRMRCFSSS
jgi:hypothetical protein